MIKWTKNPLIMVSVDETMAEEQILICGIIRVQNIKEVEQQDRSVADK